MLITPEARLLQDHLRGISNRPIEATIKFQPITSNTPDGLPYTQPVRNNGLFGPDPTAPGKQIRNRGDTFADEYLAAGRSTPPLGIYDVYRFFRDKIPQHEFDQLMAQDYRDNQSQTRKMWHLGSYRDRERMDLTWASDTIGDGKTIQYYHLEFREGARDPRLNIELPTLTLHRNLVSVAMVPLSPENHLTTGAITMTMPLREWAKSLRVAPDLAEIARAVYLSHLGYYDDNIDAVTTPDGLAVSASSRYHPEQGSVNVTQFDTSFWTDARDMVTVAINNVYPAVMTGGQNRIAQRHLAAPHRNLWSLIKHLRNGDDANQPDIRKWLGQTGAREFYLGAQEFIAKRIGAGNVFV